MELLETHEDDAAEALDCPITAFGGDTDPAISAELLSGWRERTNVEFAQHEFAGGHFFIHAEREAVVAKIVDYLSKDK